MLYKIKLKIGLWKDFLGFIPIKTKTCLKSCSSVGHCLPSYFSFSMDVRICLNSIKNSSMHFLTSSTRNLSLCDLTVMESPPIPYVSRSNGNTVQPKVFIVRKKLKQGSSMIEMSKSYLEIWLLFHSFRQEQGHITCDQ